MGSLGVTTCSRNMIFVLLLVLVVAQSSESRQMDGDQHEPKVDRDILRMSWFFDIDDMKVGTRKAIHFVKKEESICIPFIPRAKADSIPFSVKELPEILRIFKITKDSKQAEKIEGVLKDCEKQDAGEVYKTCSTSYEAMIESAQRFFETSEGPTIMTSVVRGENKRSYQNYTVSGPPEEVGTPNAMACHAENYPYAVFYCHVLHGENRVFKIPLVGDDGVKVDSVSVCHGDTSKWDPNNIAFLALGFKPGNPVCHIFPPYDNFALVHTPPPTKSSI